MHRRTTCAAAAGIAALVGIGAAGAGNAATWTPTGSMSTPRAFQTATRLHDGRVLVAGGFDVGGQPGPPFEKQAEM
jgi:hypothetical protein